MANDNMLMVERIFSVSANIDDLTCHGQQPITTDADSASYGYPDFADGACLVIADRRNVWSRF